jgi:hypothetical protein
MFLYIKGESAPDNQLLVFTMPDSLAILIHRLDTMQWHIMCHTIMIKVMKEKMILFIKTHRFKMDTDLLVLPMIKKTYLKITSRELRVPACAV